jgi:pyruvate dehydrogenase E2 component (dihydrolipoamide acetyltransferase)
MATSVIMPALEMAQESGVLVGWLKQDGQTVTKGEPLMEIETDKVTVEIEAPASGILGGILAHEGDVVPVGQTIGWILAPGETPPSSSPAGLPPGRLASHPSDNRAKPPLSQPPRTAPIEVSPLARKIADEHGIDLLLIKPSGKRIEKADVMAYISGQQRSTDQAASSRIVSAVAPNRIPASPKARRLAAERGLNLATVAGSGPEGAVLAADVLAVAGAVKPIEAGTPGTVWRLMAERMTTSWTTVPHFYLMREVDAGNLIEWRRRVTPTVEKQSGIKPTYTDLLVKLIGSALHEHPRLNAAWADGNIRWNQKINVGVATAVEDGLIVPVIHDADTASLAEIATQRHDLVERARDRKLRPVDIAGGTFTLSNLGMYNVDAFNAIVNTPQAGILTVGRIADRVVPVDGQAVVRPTMVMTLSCDHRLVDGARAAQFLDALADLIEDPWKLLS